MLNDLRFALRSYLKSPGSPIVAVLASRSESRQHRDV